MANHHFNCSVSCEGIFVDVEWEEENTLATMAATNLEKLSGEKEGKVELLNVKKFANLVKDYVAHKKKYVQHFKYDPAAGSSNYGEVSFLKY